MKIFDTLDENQKNAIFTSKDTAVGIFNYFPSNIIKPDDYNKMSKEYYLSRSGEKETSPFYDKIIANTSELYKAQQFASSTGLMMFWKNSKEVKKKVFRVKTVFRLLKLLIKRVLNKW